MGISQQNPEDLLLRVGRGDAIAFELLYRNMAVSIQRFLMGKGLSEVAAEDIVQEVFYRVWRQRDRFVAKGASAETYIFQIALNVGREHRRLENRTVRLPETLAEGLAVPCETDGNRWLADLEEMLSRGHSTLTNVQSEAIHLVYRQQLAPRDAAKLVGCTEKALIRRLQEARRKLRIIMTSYRATLDSRRVNRGAHNERATTISR